MDCRPILRTDASALWVRAEKEMDAIYVMFKDACSRAGITAYVGKNNRFDFPFAVLFEAWVPVGSDPAVTHRINARVQVVTKPYHRYEIEYLITLDRWGQAMDLGTYATFNQRTVDAIMAYLQNGPKRKLKLPDRITAPKMSFWEQLTSLKNKQVVVRQDWAALAATLALIGGMVLGPVGISNELPLAALLGVFLFLLGLIYLIARGHRRVQVRTSGKPEHDPRYLQFGDTWQVVISGAGAHALEFRRRIQDSFDSGAMPGMRHEIETLRYRSPDGIAEREQLVVQNRRVIVYCQVYSFGADLFLGWQAFLNRGLWTESTVATGIDRQTGQPTKVNSVVPGTLNLNEYDHADLSCLTEWIHSRIVTTTKQLLKQLQIDQEIDFKILRGDRPGIQSSTQSSPENKDSSHKSVLGSLFRRKA